MVPRSHSRAMVSEVSIAAMIIMITATSPGTIMLRLVICSLNHTRVRTESGAVARLERTSTREDHARTMPWV